MSTVCGVLPPSGGRIAFFHTENGLHRGLSLLGRNHAQKLLRLSALRVDKDPVIRRAVRAGKAPAERLARLQRDDAQALAPDRELGRNHLPRPRGGHRRRYVRSPRVVGQILRTFRADHTPAVHAHLHLDLIGVERHAVLHGGKVGDRHAVVLLHKARLHFAKAHVRQIDLCVFQAGNQICADAVVEKGSLRVNEALITGEADEVVKNPGDILYSGSFVVSGKGYATLTKVGLSSFAAQLMLEAKASRKNTQTEMMCSLDRLVRIIGIAIIPIGILLFLQQHFVIGSTIQESVVSMIASLVGMIPEGLYLLASIALVVSVMRLGRKKVLVHEMACVETLARVNVLCVDKTGTITENKMSVREIIPLAKEEEETSLHALIGDVVANLDADNITMQALKDYFDGKSERKAQKVIPFSSQRKYSGVRFEEGLYLIGAPERLLAERYGKYDVQILDKIDKGVRVLVFGRYGEEQHLFEPLAFILVSNPIRRDARETFEYFQKEDVCIKVISGDHPKAAAAVAKKAGIVEADRYIDVSQLSDEELEKAAPVYTVFGRVSPEQKKKLLLALKKAGNVVAMTGDGVNDVLALKEADCSIAMASGSEAASNAAQIVLLDSDFARMPSVVLEGRRVVNNIQRSASLFLVKNLFSMLMTLFTFVAVSKYPLYPTQLSFLGTFTIGTPAFLLAMQPDKSRIEGHFLTNVVLLALPAALTDFILLAVLNVAGNCAGIGHEQLSTMCIMILLAVGMAALIRICMPLDKIRTGICILMASGAVFSVLFLKPLFALYPLSPVWVMVTGILMAAAVPVFAVMCRLVLLQVQRHAKHSKKFRERLGRHFKS